MISRAATHEYGTSWFPWKRIMRKLILLIGICCLNAAEIRVDLTQAGRKVSLETNFNTSWKATRSRLSNLQHLP
jgi:hypothetical protein